MMDAETEEKDVGKKKKHEKNVDADKSTPDPIDKDFTAWMTRLFRDNERAEKIVVQQLLGKSANINGEIIKTLIFHDLAKQPSQEEIVYASNELFDEMQAEADSLHRSRTFAVIAYNAKKGGAFGRRTISLEPKRINLRMNGHGDHDGADDEVSPFAINGTDMLQERFKSAQADNRWLFEQMSGAVGGTLSSLLEQNKMLMDKVSELFRVNMELTRQNNEAENNKLDRDLIRAREQIKLDLQRSGMNLLEAHLPGVISKLTHSVGKNGTKKTGSRTSESITIETVVDSLTENERNYLFGYYEEGVCQSPGVLTDAQTRILAAVQEGREDPAVLGQLQNGEHRITQDQIETAKSSGNVELEKLLPLLAIVQRHAAQAAGKGT